MKSTWGSKSNNIGFIRFALASIVVLVHVQNLSLLPELQWIPALFSSAVAVQGFFILSGFLVMASFEQSKSLRSYAIKRVRRLYPAYVISVIGFATCLSLISTLSFVAYFTGPFLKYAFWNLLFANFMQPTIADIFSGNPKEAAVNGALWTLKLEVMFYICVPFIAILARRIGSNTTILLLFIGSLVYSITTKSMMPIPTDVSKQLPGQLTFFCVGMAFYYNMKKLPFSPVAATVLGLAIFLTSEIVIAPVLRPIGLGLVVMGIAYGPYLGEFEKYGDFSYGIYIIHFPIVQILIAETSLTKAPIGLLICSYSLALVGAIAMWHLVERRFLARSNHYRQEEQRSLAATGTIGA